MLLKYFDDEFTNITFAPQVSKLELAELSASLGSTTTSSAMTLLNGVLDFLLSANLSDSAFFLSSSMPESLASGGALTGSVDSAEDSSGDGVGAATTFFAGAGVEVTNFPFLLAGAVVLLSESESESSEEVSAFLFTPAFGATLGATLAVGFSSSSEESESDEESFFAATGAFLVTAVFLGGDSSSESDESSEEESLLAPTVLARAFTFAAG